MTASALTASTSSPGTAPLAGLRVLDLSRVLSGPMASMVLADLGAHVIKVEDLVGSDTTRHNPPYIHGESHYFLSLNRNKESLSIDLKHPEGLAIARRLAEQSDIVLENFRPGVADRLGLGYEALSRLNPRLVYCSLAGFGQTGPLRDKTAYDLVIQAMTGAMSVTGEPGRPAVKMGLPLADELTGMFAAINILAAIERRERTGRGGYIDVAMFDVGVALLSCMGTAFFATGESAGRPGSAHPTLHPSGAFGTRDGYVVVAVATQPSWRRFAAAIGRPELADDPRFATIEARSAARGELGAILEPILRARTTAEWVSAFDACDVPSGPVHSVAQAVEAEQTRARGMVTEVEHPTAGRMRTLGTPFHLDFDGAPPFRPAFVAAPVLGQHTTAILRDLLGFDAAAIERLAAQHVVRVSEVPGATRPGSRPTPAAPVAPTTSATSAPPAEAPLGGLRVLDLTCRFAGPFATLILADLGAEVIKIEQPDGDPTRGNPPFARGESTDFMALNRGKKSVVLDLRSAEGRQALLDLAAGADVLVESDRPGAMDELGLSTDDLRRANPGLIVCSISGYGQTGPLRDKESSDLISQAMAGTMAITGEEGRPPVRIGLPVSDFAGGIFAALAVLAARRQQRQVGGARIDIGLHDVLVGLLGYMAQLYFTTGESPTPVGSGHHHIAPYRAYEASDGEFVVSAFSQEFWLKFTRAIGRPGLAEDPRFRTINERKEHKHALDALLEPVFRTRTVDEWLRLLEAGDVPCAKIASVGEVLTSPQALAREIVFDVEHRHAGTVRTPGMPLRFDGRALRAALPPPILGEHTDAVLAELAGYDSVRLGALRAGRAIG